MKKFCSLLFQFGFARNVFYQILKMKGCVISPLLFVLAMELLLRGAANTSKGVMKNEHLSLSPSRAFMDDMTILVPSKIAAHGLLQRYYDLYIWTKPIGSCRICQ